MSANVKTRTRAAMAAAVLAIVSTRAAESSRADQNQPPGQTAPSFRAETVDVRLAVRVLDHDGLFLDDLVREDFEVRDEGIPQTLDSFVLATSRGRAASQASTNATLLPKRPPSVVTLGSRRIVVLLDDLHITPRRSVVVKGLIHDFISTVLPAGDRVALITTSGLAPQVDLTADRKVLLRELESLGGQKLPSATLEEMRRSATLSADDRADPDLRERAVDA